MLRSTSTLLSDLNLSGLADILSRLNLASYHQTRNYLDGAVSGLSPLITHGAITIPDIIDNLEKFPLKDRAGFIFQLGWREYFQKIWQDYNPLEELRDNYKKKLFSGVPIPIIERNTGLEIIDQELSTLISTGYIHNHSRLWIASLTTHIYQGNWKDSATWMYYHLLDGCPASNFLSWQWVYGSFSSKPYLFNQDNLNKYSKSNQMRTFIDCDYSVIPNLKLSVPMKPFVTESLIDECQLALMSLSTIKKEQIVKSSEILLYSIFTLDANWRSESSGLRVLWLDPKFFYEYPISPKRVEFIQSLINRIPNLSVYYGELLEDDLTHQKVFLKDHPIFKEWKIKKDTDSYILPDVTVSKDRSYFWYWKRIAKQLGINYP